MFQCYRWLYEPCSQTQRPAFFPFKFVAFISLLQIATMRLIDVSSFQFFEIAKPDDDHPYAILSHTWGEDEVTFQEFSKETTKKDLSKEMLEEDGRYSKIVGCCAEGELQGFKYVWIDTCCIDKTSSSELSEAINSMYQWYSQARVCYVYLSDVWLNASVSFSSR